MERLKRMSVQESQFIKMLYGVAITVIASIIIGLFAFVNMTTNFESKIEERVSNNRANYDIQMDQIREMHNKDIIYIQRDMQEIKSQNAEVIKILKHDKK